MNWFVLLGALAVIVGALIPVQAATNAAMSRVIGSVAITSLALFAIGFVVVAAWAIVIRVPLPSLETLRHVPAQGYALGKCVVGRTMSDGRLDYVRKTKSSPLSLGANAAVSPA